MKIKKKKEMNLPELIEWGFKQKELPPLFYGDKEGSLVQFTPGGWVNITAIEPTDTFTVEIEEQIDENTKLIALVELSSQGLLGNTRLYRYHSINDVIDDQSVAFYILNDDQTMDLIWKNGKLVE